MNKFICPRCHLNTHIRTHFKRHLTRKNICKPIYKDVPIKSIAESYGIDISTTENIEGDTHVYTEGVDTHIQFKNKQGHKMYTCKYCDKSFNSSTSRCRHQRMYCKNKNKNKNENETKSSKE